MKSTLRRHAATVIVALLWMGAPAAAQNPPATPPAAPAGTTAAQNPPATPPAAPAGTTGTAAPARVEPSPTPPVVKAVTAIPGVLKGVVAGGTVLLETSGPLPSDYIPKATITSKSPKPSGSTTTPAADEPRQLQVHAVIDKGVVVGLPSDLSDGLYEVQLTATHNGQTLVLQRPHLLNVKNLWWIITWSLGPLILVVIILVLILAKYKTSQGGASHRILTLLFLEPENQTYSLSRAQFVIWVSALGWAYVFLFLARGLVETKWEFPPLAGFGFTFLVSLGTLVAAQATSTIKGVKGAGEFHPSLADLVVHGGVLALERVQQLFWTIIAVGMFLWIVVRNYAIATELPAVPNELLILMGVSAAGYIGGKMARKAGPVIRQVKAMGESLSMVIEGERLSKEAVVQLDGKPLTQKPVATLSDPQAPNEFARELQIGLDATPYATEAQWYGDEHSVVVVNPDAQRAEWLSKPVIKTVEAVSAEGNTATFKVTAEYVGERSEWEVRGATLAPGTRPTRDPAKSNTWKLTIVTSPGRAKPYDEIIVRATNGQTASWPQTPSPAQ